LLAFNVNGERRRPVSDIARRYERTLLAIGIANTVRAKKVSGDSRLYCEIDVLRYVINGAHHPQGVKLRYHDPNNVSRLIEQWAATAARLDWRRYL
jgi:hypothetical protein